MGIKVLSDHVSCVADVTPSQGSSDSGVQLRQLRSLQFFTVNLSPTCGSNWQKRIEDDRRPSRSLGRAGQYDYGAAQAPAQPPGARVLLMAAGLPHVFVKAFPERLHQSFVCSAAAVVGWQEMLFKFTSSQSRSIRLLPTRRVVEIQGEHKITRSAQPLIATLA